MRNGKKISVVLIGSVLLAAAFIIGFSREYLRNRSIEKEIAGLEAENSRLDGKRLEFLSLIDDLSSEYYLEEQARKKQGMAKPGETLILVDTGENSGQPKPKVLGASDALLGMSNPTKWLYYFFDHEHFLELRKL